MRLKTYEPAWNKEKHNSTKVLYTLRGQPYYSVNKKMNVRKLAWLKKIHAKKIWSDLIEYERKNLNPAKYVE